LISDDLPVPRAPVSSTLFAGALRTNCRVFCSISPFWRSMLQRSSSDNGDRFGTGCRKAAPLTLTPAKCHGAVPVDFRRSRRQHPFYARQHGLGARQKLFEFVHGKSVVVQER
jgi:hypothetical protein